MKIWQDIVFIEPQIKSARSGYRDQVIGIIVSTTKAPSYVNNVCTIISADFSLNWKKTNGWKGGKINIFFLSKTFLNLAGVN